MRFMLRAKDVEEARIAEKRSSAVGLGLGLGAGGVAGAGGGASPATAITFVGRKVISAVADDETTAGRCLGVAVTDSGACVAGRRSWHGAHKGVEAFARAAYAHAGCEPDVSDMAMAEAIAPANRRTGKGIRGGGSGGGPASGRPSGLSIINGAAPGRRTRLQIDAEAEEEEGGGEDDETTDADADEAIIVGGGDGRRVGGGDWRRDPKKKTKHVSASGERAGGPPKGKRARLDDTTSEMAAYSKLPLSKLPFVRPT